MPSFFASFASFAFNRDVGSASRNRRSARNAWPRWLTDAFSCGESSLERRVKEDGVVAETAGTLRPGGNAAFDDGRRLEQELSPIHEGQGAHETGGGVSGAFCAQCFVNQRKLVG